MGLLCIEVGAMKTKEEEELRAMGEKEKRYNFYYNEKVSVEQSWPGFHKPAIASCDAHLPSPLMRDWPWLGWRLGWPGWRAGGLRLAGRPVGTAHR
jgi:hypothetical protein